eukprot:g2763.t1
MRPADWQRLEFPHLNAIWPAVVAPREGASHSLKVTDRTGMTKITRAIAQKVKAGEAITPAIMQEYAGATALPGTAAQKFAAPLNGKQDEQPAPKASMEKPQFTAKMLNLAQGKPPIVGRIINGAKTLPGMTTRKPLRRKQWMDLPEGGRIKLRAGGWPLLAKGVGLLPQGHQPRTPCARAQQQGLPPLLRWEAPCT